jgi:hypothetical protein
MTMTMGKRIPDNQSPGRIGLAWYKPDQWLHLLQVSSDSNKLEPTYEEWLLQAQKTLKRLKVQGIRAEKVIVDVVELTKWCRGHNYPIDAGSRASYVAEVLSNLDKNKD